MHRLPQGAELLPGGGVHFRLWAPGCDRIGLALHQAESGQRDTGQGETVQAAFGEALIPGQGEPGQGEPRQGEPRQGVPGQREQGRATNVPPQILPMRADGAGWHDLTVPEAAAGMRYQFVLPDGLHVPDPASRFQPEDVHGPSEIVDPAAYVWRDAAWTGRPWNEAAVYELHIGAFTEAGTFRAAIERLDHLAALGVTAVELMPIADFPGRRNWGYDGVLPYAPDSSYGRPEDLKALVDAAHARGLMVLLDVVYNHFGPDGNYLPVYAPGFFTERHHTPWGAAINFDGPDSRPVREFVIHNALYWISEYHFDGLRLDAVHAILDDSPKDVLDELAERVRPAGRHIHLVLENEENQASRLTRDAGGNPLHYTAQWNDDVHHVLHAAATGEGSGYYGDYLGDTAKLARALAEGFAFQGETMEFRGSPRGSPSGSLPPPAFVAFIQNHDQIGNRAFGERITAIAPPAAVRAIAAVYLLLPQVPMLFMGEEWGASQPFPFFCDFGGDLGEAVRRGRREEFAKFPEFQDETVRARIPDPQAERTFASAKLVWSDLEKPEHAAWRSFYGKLLAVRRDVLWPLLPQLHGNSSRAQVLGPLAVLVCWRTEQGDVLTLAANLSAQPAQGFPRATGRILWQEGTQREDGSLDPWSVCWSLERAGSALRRTGSE